VHTKKKLVTTKRIVGYWWQRENRRQFLIDLATSKGLDPFDPSTWNIIKCEDVDKAKVCKQLNYVCITLTSRELQGSGLFGVLPFRQAVVDAFPEIQFGLGWATQGLSCLLQ
jgi:hypothetical protein